MAAGNVPQSEYKCYRPALLVFFPKSQFTSTPLPSSMLEKYTINVEAIFQMRNKLSLQCFPIVAIPTPTIS